MKLAYEQALKAYEIGDIPVGAVIVKDGKILSKAYNKRNLFKISTYHAEILAIEKAARKIGDWRLDGCDIYVTLEPCEMCLGAIKESRIKNIYYGAKKNVESVNYTEMTWLQSDDCSELLKKFFKSVRK